MDAFLPSLGGLVHLQSSESFLPFSTTPLIPVPAPSVLSSAQAQTCDSIVPNSKTLQTLENSPDIPTPVSFPLSLRDRLTLRTRLHCVRPYAQSI